MSTDAERWYVPIDTPDGQQVLFFDTGYARTTCDDALVAMLGVRVRGHTRIRGEVGSTVARHARLPGLRLGEHVIRGVRCQVRDLGTSSSIVDPAEGAVAGVLGIDVLRRFVLEIDPSAPSVELVAPSTPPVHHDAVERLYLEAGVGPRLLVGVHVGGRRIRPVLDTGADQTWVRGRSADLTPTQVKEGIRVRGTGAPGGELRTLAYYHLDEVGVGGQVARDLVFIERSRPWWSDGLLGLDVIGQFHGIYDLSRRRFSLAPVEPALVPAWIPGQPTPAAIIPAR